MKNISKVIYVVCLIIIIAGFIVYKTLGINYSTELSKSTIVEIYFDNATNINEIKEISKEVFGNNIKVNEIERFSDAFSIQVTNEITDEQKNSFITKINEKYSIEKTTDDLTIVDVPKMQGMDLIRNYIKPTIISIILIFVYLCIRYIKIGNIKTAILTIIKTAIITGAYFGLVIITRLPIVNIYTIPVGMLITIISLIVLCCKNENKIEEIKEEKE